MSNIQVFKGWSRLILPALGVTLGMQLTRAFLAYLQYLLGDRLGLPPAVMGLVALAVFSAGFLVAWLNRRLGLRRLLLLSTGGIGLARLLVQLWPGDPLVSLLLVAVGTVCFVLILPTFLAFTYWRGYESGISHQFGQGILLGLALDTSLHGFFFTYDMIWQAGITPILLTLGLAMILWVALAVEARSIPPHLAPLEPPLQATLSWAAIGPFLFLQLLVFQNQARLSALTNWPLPVTSGAMLVAQLAGLGVATFWQPGRLGIAVLGAVLVITLWPFTPTAIIILALLIAGQIAAAGLISTIIHRLGAQATLVYFTIGTPKQPQEGIKYTAVAHGCGMVLMVVLIFLYYIPFSISVPNLNSWLLPLAGLMIGLGAAIIGFHHIPLPRPKYPAFLAVACGLLLLILPLQSFLTWQQPIPKTSSADSLQVITYNIHNGYNTQGQLDLEALAQVIEAQQPDMVALQEVSRGWVVNGSVDTLAWLGQRLGMAYVFAPSADSLWGQAVLSKYPVAHVDIQPLPPDNLPLKRSFMYLQLDTGQPEPVQLVNTHLHQIVANSDIRVAQIKTILKYLDGYTFNQLLFTGDLNATPDTPEIELLYSYGFVDTITQAGVSPEHTYHAARLHKRLDYLLVSPDFVPTNVTIPRSAASDHLPVTATLYSK